MIKSMTAYAQAKRQAEHTELTIEIRSYNSRYLDLNLRLPFAYLPLEDRIKQQVQKRIARGRVEVRFQIRETSVSGCAFEVDEAKAKGYAEALDGLKSFLGLTGEVTLDLVAAAGDIIRPVEAEQDLDARWPLVEAALKDALGDLDGMRLQEGSALGKDFHSRLTLLENLLERIEDLSAGLLPIYQQRLLERVSALTADVVDIDLSRIAQEAAILAEKSDISEEIVRARSHIEQFRNVMTADAPAGRKLNFLLQEFNREFNTMGSKTARSEIAHLVVEAKSEVEKIREQVQNVE